MQIDIRADIKAATRDLTNIQKKQIPFATSKTLNRLAFELTKKGGTGVVGKKTKEVFRKKSGGTGATRFTTRNFFFQNSTKYDLTAYVFWDESNADFMKFMVQGGTRFPKKRAIRVATKHSKKHLDAFGNFKKGALDDMLSDKAKFFKGVPKGSRGRDEGIWERYGRKTKKGTGQKIRMVAAFTTTAKYKPRFPFGTFVEGYVFSRNDGFAKKFRKNLEDAINSPKGRR